MIERSETEGVSPRTGDVTAAIENVRKWLNWTEHSVSPFVATLLAEVERLRAEREALHSDETRERIRHTISAYTNRPLVNDANRLAVEKAVDEVLSVLSASEPAGSEATR